MWQLLATNDDDVGQDNVWISISKSATHSLSSSSAPAWSPTAWPRPRADEQGRVRDVGIVGTWDRCSECCNSSDSWISQDPEDKLIICVDERFSPKQVSPFPHQWPHCHHHHHHIDIVLGTSNHNALDVWHLITQKSEWESICVHFSQFHTYVCMFVWINSSQSHSCSLGYFSSQTSVSAEYPSHQIGV